jgi:hypothetical protein
MKIANCKLRNARERVCLDAAAAKTPHPCPLPIGWGEGTDCKVIAVTAHQPYRAFRHGGGQDARVGTVSTSFPLTFWVKDLA